MVSLVSVNDRGSLLDIVATFTLRFCQLDDPTDTRDTSTGSRPMADESKRGTFHKVMLQRKLISYKITKSWSH